MHVLMVTPRFNPDVGGVERHVEQLGRRLVELGCNVTVLTTGLERSLAASESVHGMSVRRVAAWPKGSDYHLAPRLLGEISRGSWDVVHVQSYHTFVAPIAMVASMARGVPYVVTFHGGGHSSRLRNRLRVLQLRLLRPLLARAARLVAVARFEIDFYGCLLRLAEERFVLIPNGSDIRAGPAPARPDGSRMLIASVGRLERYKGHQRVLAALPYILRESPDAAVWIAGSGPYEQTLRDLARELGVADRVTIEAVPAASPEVMAERLSRATVVALLSEFETHPLAAIESLALGCPLVVADTSGLRELADQGLARAVPIDSHPAEVAAALLEEGRAQGRAPIPSLPTWDDCAAGHLELYRSLLEDAA